MRAYFFNARIGWVQTYRIWKSAVLIIDFPSELQCSFRFQPVNNRCLMDIPTEFDHPLFKKLANNDTGKAVGHQGGIVIPKDLNRYFPDLSGKVTTTSATVDEPIRAALFVKNSLKGVVVTRYQYQTWGHTRRERRITGNLAALRNAASEGDYLIIERSLDDPIFFRLRLLDATDPDFKKVRAKIGDRKWGSLDLKDQPVTSAIPSF